MSTKLACLYISRLFGALGFQIFSIYALLRAYEIQPSLSALGTLGLSTFLSVVVFSFASGSVIDKVQRPGLYALILHSLITILALAIIFSPPTHLMSLYILVFALGSFRVMRSPIYFVGTQLLMSELKPNDKTQIGFARFFVGSWQLAGVIGPLLGSAVALNFGLHALQIIAAFFFSLALIFLLPLTPLRASATVQRSKSTGIKESFKFFFDNSVVRETFLIDTIGVLFAGASAFLPFLLKEAGISPDYFGVIRSAQNAGALMMTLSIGREIVKYETGKLFVVAVLVFAALTIAVPFISTLFAFIAVFTMLGLADGISILVRDLVLFQTATPHLRGRIYALNSIFISSSDDLGEMESGFVGQLIGIPAAAIAGGVICAAITLYFTTRSKNLWNFQLGAPKRQLETV